MRTSATTTAELPIRGMELRGLRDPHRARTGRVALSSVSVVTNSLRLKRFRPTPLEP
jgi:hypothetical protein